MFSDIITLFRSDWCSAQRDFDDLVSENSDVFCSELCLLFQSRDVKDRAIAVVLLRRLFSGGILPLLSSIKESVLLRIVEEVEEDIRLKLCLLVSMVGPVWPEFWPTFLQLSASKEERQLSSAVTILLKLSPDDLISNISDIQQTFSKILCNGIKLRDSAAMEGLINIVQLVSPSFPTEAEILRVVLDKLIRNLPLALKDTDRANEAFLNLNTLIDLGPTLLPAELTNVIEVLLEMWIAMHQMMLLMMMNS